MRPHVEVCASLPVTQARVATTGKLKDPRRDAGNSDQRSDRSVSAQPAICHARSCNRADILT